MFPEPAAVPLPASIFLLLGSIGGLYAFLQMN
ncbi:MAG: VPLPA-CTERM sorting domain-containing protein [Alphaproteobacteria bacterium]